MMNLNIRNALVGDALAMSKFAAERFTDTFGFVYDPQDLQHHLATKYTQEVFANYINDHAMLNILALNEDDEITGFAQAGDMALPLDGAIKQSTELYRFYVSNEAKGTGLAKKLYQRVLEYAIARQSKVLYLGVWSQNARAIAFYKRLGFEEIGKYLYQVGKTFDDERIMRLELE